MQTLANAIISSVDNGKEGVDNPVNWPDSAMFAVSYKHKDRQFPNVRHSTCYAYFTTERELSEWEAEQCEFVIGTDHDFTVDFSVYKWDLGPNFVRPGTIY